MSGSGAAVAETKVQAAGLRSREGPRPVIVITGPTAVGKTGVALLVAARLSGEIVSADSRQIYRGMDIGTAKPTADERSAVRHHLIDIVDPSERYDAARYACDAEETIGRLLARGVEPLVTGGTGFYLASLFEGLFVGPPADASVRAGLARRLASEGPAALHGELARIDPGAAARIHPNDASRILRALEVHAATGRTLSDWHAGARRAPTYAARYFALTRSRRSLRERIEARVDGMMEAGLLAEVAALRAEGRLLPGMPGATAVGYRELLALDDARDEALAAAVERIKTSTRRYAKRQLTWFRALPGVRWLDLDSMGPEEAASTIARSARPAAETP